MIGYTRGSTQRVHMRRNRGGQKNRGDDKALLTGLFIIYLILMAFIYAFDTGLI